MKSQAPQLSQDLEVRTSIRVVWPWILQAQFSGHTSAPVQSKLDDQPALLATLPFVPGPNGVVSRWFWIELQQCRADVFGEFADMT